MKYSYLTDLIIANIGREKRDTFLDSWYFIRFLAKIMS